MRKIKGKIKNDALKRKYRRKLSIRSKIVGSAERPRISVTKSNKNLFVQVIDDSASKTLFSVQTFGKNRLEVTGNVEGAKAVGQKVAELMKSNKLSAGVFDRSGNRYHGALAALGNAIRDNGIQI